MVHHRQTRGHHPACLCRGRFQASSLTVLLSPSSLAGDRARRSTVQQEYQFGYDAPEQQPESLWEGVKGILSNWWRSRSSR